MRRVGVQGAPQDLSQGPSCTLRVDGAQQVGGGLRLSQGVVWIPYPTAALCSIHTLRPLASPTGIGWTAAYSGSYSTLVVPLQMLPGLEGKLVRCRTERIGR